jgi:hypothetical protein
MIVHQPLDDHAPTVGRSSNSRWMIDETRQKR